MLARQALAASGRAVGAWVERHDAVLFLSWCVWWTLLVGVQFITALLHATGGQWSAPLDDTFIHFDYARSFARGRFFEWSAGNGFSSGNTSISYPLFLAPGYALGLRDGRLMTWALGLSGVAHLTFLLGASRLLRPLGPWAKYLLPPISLCVGFVNWSLCSGMETAFFLGAWGLLLLVWDRFVGLPDQQRLSLSWRGTLAVGLALGFATLTRPEALPIALLWGIAMGSHLTRRRLALLLLVPCMLLGLWLLLCRVFTGEFAQAGSVAKLVWFDPYLTAVEKLLAIISNLRFIVTRTTWHHFSDAPPFGLVLPLFALLPLLDSRTRRAATVIWLQIVAWCLLVAQNPHVRYQNERYLVIPTSWLLVLSAMGVAVSLRGWGEARAQRLSWGLRATVVFACSWLFWLHQAPNQRFQRWFFARACRNIAEQQLKTGTLLSKLEPRRIFVGDAGAITYIADRPGLDGIGLGGYHDLPFARAYRHGVGATIELLERVPAKDRPDYLALYPSWWGELPETFGQRIFDVTIEGNVICGASTKSVYRADWWALDAGAEPAGLGSERVVDELDVADLVSEREHAVTPLKREGEVFWKVRRRGRRGREAFDAGRHYGAGAGLMFELESASDQQRLVLRGDGEPRQRVLLRLNGAPLEPILLEPSAEWAEGSVELPPTEGRMTVEVVASEDGLSLSHVWLLTSSR